MMKLKNIHRKTIQSTNLCDLKLGQVGQIIQSGAYYGHFVLATFDRIVDLTEPNHSWNIVIDGSLSQLLDCSIELLPSGTILEFEVNNEDD